MQRSAFAFRNLVGGLFLAAFAAQASAQNVFYEPFKDNSQAWGITGPRWQIGSAVAAGPCPDYGTDPGTDATPTFDNGVAGTVIGGCLGTSSYGFEYLTSPAMDTTSVAGTVQLRFQRWLGSDYPPYMYSTVDVFDGTSWQNLFTSGGDSDSSWNQIVFDVTAYKNPQFRVRFGTSIQSGGVFDVSGWNIDDVYVGAPATVPSAPILTSTVPGNGTVDVNFTLSSDGGSPITGFTATCGAQSNTGLTSPIQISGLANGVPVTCDVYATNALGNGPNSATSSPVTPGPSGIWINDVQIIESNSGTKAMTFTVTRFGTTSAVTFNWDTADGTALAGSDYNAVVGGTATINAGGTGTKTITVQLLGDTLDEFDETLFVNLSNVVGAPLLDGQGQGTIVDNDNPPNMSVNSINTNPEAATTANFVITLNKASGKTITVTAQTSDVTATAGLDYTGVAPTLITFNPGEVSKPFPVGILHDTMDENNETFHVDLSGVANAVITTAPGVGTITDDDAPPTLSINDATVSEGASATTTTANFTVTLSAPSGKVVTFEYVTVDQSATVGTGDYVAAGPTTLVFNPGDPLTKNIAITVNGDDGDEQNETYKVVISGVTGTPPNATFADNTGVGTITDDDATPSFSINDVSLTEGDAGTQNAVFTVTLSAPSGQTTSVKATTVAGTASAISDYTNPGAQTLTFPAGATTAQYTVPVVGDLLNEATTETFTVTLTQETNATVSDATGVGTITDNDPQPVLSISDFSATEGDAGNQTFTFNVTLSAPSGRTVTVAAQTANNTATSPSDYNAKGPQTLTFAAGETTKPFTVTVKGDTLAEADETFYVNLSGEVNAGYGDSQGVGTIVNNDPAISISDATVTEGGQLAFVVTRTAGTAAVTFDWAATDGTATVANNDYGPTVSGSGLIPAGSPGDTTTVYVDTVADTDIEGHETLTVTLSNSTGAGIIDGVATGTIYNDDAVPAGALVFSEFRFWGPSFGSSDAYVEIANTTSSPITVGATDLSGGFALALAGDPFVFAVIPDGAVIPANGRFLVGGSGYVGADMIANGPWATCCFSVGYQYDIALFRSAVPSAGAVLDAVGDTYADFGYPHFHEGTELPQITLFPSTEWAWVRKHVSGPGGALQDTNNNANDFVLVDVNASNFGSAGNGVLGAPSPENSTSETDYNDTDMYLGLVWPATGPNGAFNRQSPPTGGGPAGFELRRMLYNNTAQTFGNVRFKVTGITTLNSPVTVTPTQAQVRVQTSTATGSIMLPDTSTFNAAALTLEAPVQPLGGGLNSTLRLNTGLPLAPGGSQAVNFRLSTHAAGGYFYWVVVEAKP